MKKVPYLFSLFLVTCLTSCSFGPIPKLYSNFEKASFTIRNATKKEWEPIVVGDYSYIHDFEHGPSGAALNYFLRVFYDDKLIFEKISDSDFWINSAFILKESLCFPYSSFDSEDINNSSVTQYCMKVNKNGESSTFSLDGDYSNWGVCTDGTYCYFHVQDRKTFDDSLIKTDSNGEIISVSSINDRISSLFCYEKDIYSFSFDYEDDSIIHEVKQQNILKLEEDNTFTKIMSAPGIIEYSNCENELFFISHTSKNNEHHFYRTDLSGTSEICYFSVPDDLHYDYVGLDYYDGDLIIGMVASTGSITDFYGRTIFLYYDSMKKEIYSYCPNQNLYEILFKNHRVFYGKYTNTYSDGTKNGNFKEIII